MRKGQTWLLLMVCVWTVAALLPLEKEDIDGKYQIGTIQNLYFFKDKVFFHADSDLFGFLGQKDGQLISVYELELDLGERLISANAYTVTIARDKNINVFWPATSEYLRSFEGHFLEKHPDFAKIVATLPSMEGAYVLTDKYLMVVPLVAKGNKVDSVTEKILIELTDPTEVFYALFTVYNREVKRLETYMGSLIQNDKVNQVCFRQIRDGKVLSKKCTELKAEDEVEDIVASATSIYVEVTGGVLVLDAKAELLERLDSEAQQYFSGMVTIGDDHQFYSPMTKSAHNLRIIEQTETSRNRGPMGILGLAVQENTFQIHKATKDHKFNTLLSFPRGPQDDPRKVWSYSQDNHIHFRLYIEFDDGRLSCSNVDTQKKTLEKLWEITTIQSVKVTKGELQAKDIQEEGMDAKSPKAAEPQDVKQSQRQDIAESVPPQQP